MLAEFPVEEYVNVKYQGTSKEWGMNIPKWKYLIPRF